MKKYIYFFLLAAVFTLPLIVLYPVGQAQRPSSEIPISDGTEKTTPDSQTLDGTAELQLKPKASASDVIPVLVQLTGRPLGDIYAEVLATPHTSKAQGEEMAREATRTQNAFIQRQQQQVAAALNSSAIGGREIYRVNSALNGIAIMVSADKLDRIRRLPGVKSAERIELEYPTNSTSIPFSVYRNSGKTP